jgi:hypothetical protein
MQRTRRALPAALLLVPVLSLVGCDADESNPAVSFHRDVRPVMESKCGGCHYEDGPAPISMKFDASEWTEGPPEWLKLAVETVDNGTMPPWSASKDCREYVGDRSLTDEERELFLRWRDGGFPEGQEDDFVAPSRTSLVADTLGPPTFELPSSDGYIPSPYNGADDYRCFLLEATFDEETYLVSTSLEPGVEALGHHALLYLIPPEEVAAIEKFVDEDDVAGYECFGGTGSSSLTTLGGWAPGAQPGRLPDGAASVIPKGSRLVLQMHYNVLAFAADAEIPADVSYAKLWTTEEKPSWRVESLPMAHLAMKVPAGEKASVQERTFELPADGLIIANSPHMHVLGTEISVWHESVETGDKQCMIDIPRWDFHWQGGYGMVDPIEGKKGDKIHLSCTYDNSPAHQPEVHGEQIMPRDVYWGEGTYDEMCLNYVLLMVPFAEENISCGAFDPCIQTCADGDGTCFFNCSTVGGGQCASCLIDAVSSCAPPHCPDPGIALIQCLGKWEGDYASGINHGCRAEWNDFYACMQTPMEAGDCDAQISVCGLQYSQL